MGNFLRFLLSFCEGRVLNLVQAKERLFNDDGLLLASTPSLYIRQRCRVICQLGGHLARAFREYLRVLCREVLLTAIYLRAITVRCRVVMLRGGPFSVKIKCP